MPTYDNVAKPNQKYWNDGEICAINEEKCKGKNSEADGMAEERKVTTYELKI